MKLLSFILLFINCSWAAIAQDKYLVLKQEKIATIPADYHISGVIDDRADKNSVGHISYKNGGRGDVVFHDGASALMAYIDKNAVQNKSTKPIFLHISDFNADVKQLNGQWDINITATITFYASGYKLVEYVGKVNAQTSDAPESYVEGYLRKIIDKDLEGFNKWWPENKDLISTSPDVQVNVSIAKTSDKPDAIIYSLSQPLQIADFTGPEQATGNEMAMTASGISMSFASTVEKGEIVVNVVIKPYFDTRTSWFKEGGKIPAVLEHEQAHFDITAIKACELAAAIRAAKFTKDDYMTQLEKLRKEKSDASYEEENTYDTETNHGIIKDKQLEWQNKLSQQVRTIGCY